MNNTLQSDNENIYENIIKYIDNATILLNLRHHTDNDLNSNTLNVEIVLGKIINDPKNKIYKIYPFYETISPETYNNTLDLFKDLFDKQQLFDIQELCKGSLYNEFMIKYKIVNEKVYKYNDYTTIYFDDETTLSYRDKLQKHEDFKLIDGRCHSSQSSNDFDLRISVKTIEKIPKNNLVSKLNYSDEIERLIYEFDFFGIIVKFIQSSRNTNNDSGANSMNSIKIYIEKSVTNDNRRLLLDHEKDVLTLIFNLILKNPKLKKSEAEQVYILDYRKYK